MEIPIGELARRTRVKVPTIRYYEQIGLIPAPPRTRGKQRRYGAPEISRLNFIRHARELGFDVAAIRELLELSAQPDRSCAEADRIARHHMIEVDRRIAQLLALRAELQHMVDECSHSRIGNCQVIEALSGNGA